MPPESNLERRCRLETEKRGGKLIKFVSPGNKGVPDRLLIVKGRLAFIEFKRDAKAETQPLQDYWQRWLRDNGQLVSRIYQFNDFTRLLDTLLL